MNGGSLVLTQLYQLAVGMAAGALGGCAFCVYRRTVGKAARKPGTRRRLLLRDAIFSLGLIAVWLGIWFSATDGSLRVMVFVWLAAGMALFMIFLQKPLDRVLMKRTPVKKRSRKRSKRRQGGQRENRLLDLGAGKLYVAEKSLREKYRGAGKKVREKLHKSGKSPVDEDKSTDNY